MLLPPARTRSPGPYVSIGSDEIFRRTAGASKSGGMAGLPLCSFALIMPAPRASVSCGSVVAPVTGP